MLNLFTQDSCPKLHHVFAFILFQAKSGFLFYNCWLAVSCATYIIISIGHGEVLFVSVKIPIIVFFLFFLYETSILLLLRSSHL